MNNIITALNNPKLNIELKKEKNINIINKDIIYKEGILEILEEIKDKKIKINKIIINYELPGEIENEELIKLIKKRNKKIEIIYILEKEDKEKEKILEKNNIKKIYYKNKINNKNLSKILNEQKNKEQNIEKEIKQKSYENQIKKIQSIRQETCNRRIFKPQKNKHKKNYVHQITLIHEDFKNDTNHLSLELISKLKDKESKILLVDMKTNNEDLHKILNKNNAINKIKNKEVKNRNIKNEIIYIEKTYSIIINKNIKLITGLKAYLKNNQEDKIKNIIKLIKKNNKKYNYIIIEILKNKNDKINNELIKNIKNNIIIINNDLNKIKEEKILIDKIKKINKNKIKIYIKENKNKISKEILKEIFKKEKIIN